MSAVGVLRYWIRASLAALMVTSVTACATMDRSIAIAEQTVTPITVGEAAEVSAYDLASAMLRAGFTKEQILADGPAIQNALATSGGAQVRYDKAVQALFAVHSDILYVTSLTRGTFTQPLAQLPGTQTGTQSLNP